MSGFLKLNLKDFIKGLIVAVVSGVFTFLAQALSVQGFDFTSFDWSQIIRIAIVCFMSYTAKNLMSDSEGKVLGKWG